MNTENIKNTVICGDTLMVLKKLPDECVDTIITSPPYWGLRDYGIKGQIGLEKTLDEYIEKLLKITFELKRVLKKTGVMFWNHGDCYGTGSGAGSREGTKQATNRGANYYNDTGKKGVQGYEKCMMLQNYRLILSMIDKQKWILRNTIIWNKPNAMPSSVRDRFSNKYEPVFMLVKNKKYWFDLDAVRIPHKDIQDYQRHAPFNYRVREAKKGHKGIIGVKSHNKEMEQYNIKGQRKWSRVQGQSTQSIENHSGYFRNGKCLVDFSKGKNPGDVWTVTTQPFSEAHFATFPEKLITPMIKAGTPKEICIKCGKARERIIEEERGKEQNSLGASNEEGNTKKGGATYRPIINSKTVGRTDCGCNAGFEAGVVLDPFFGAGTVGVVTKKLGRNYLGIELKKDYIKMAERRINKTIYQPELFDE